MASMSAYPALFGAYGARTVGVLSLPSTVARLSEQAKVTHSGAVAGISKVWHEWLGGLQLVKKQQLITAIFVVIGVAMVGEGIIEVLFTAYVKQVMHSSALVLGWLMTAQAIGGIIGSFIVVQARKRKRPTRFIPLNPLLFWPLILVIAIIPGFPIIFC